MNILFVCNQGKHRSRTAADLFADDYATKSAGIYTNLTKQDIEWAGLVVVMEEHQRTFIAKKFPEGYMKKQILCLDIPDIYSYEQPELIALLRNCLLTITPPVY